MDRNQLSSKLEDFKVACIRIGAIHRDNSEDKLSTFVFDEIYQGVFIINVAVEDKWLNKEYHPNGLKELIELLYQTTNAKTRESILTLRLCKASFPFDTIEYPSLNDGKSPEPNHTHNPLMSITNTK